MKTQNSQTKRGRDAVWIAHQYQRCSLGRVCDHCGVARARDRREELDVRVWGNVEDGKEKGGDV